MDAPQGDKRSTEAQPVARGNGPCRASPPRWCAAGSWDDRRRLAWSRHPNGVFVVSVLRMIALGILAVARKLSRYGYSLETPSWQQVAEHFLLILCDSILDTEAFDAETA